MLSRHCWKHVTDVISIPVCQTDANTLVQKVLQIKPKVRVDEIPGILEGEVKSVITRVVKSNSERLLDLCLVEIISINTGRGWVISSMSNVVSSTSRVVVERVFNVVTAHGLRLAAD